MYCLSGLNNNVIVCNNDGETVSEIATSSSGVYSLNIVDNPMVS